MTKVRTAQAQPGNRPIPPRRRVGLWLIGAGGNIAATIALGLSALHRRMAAPIGLLTEQQPLAGLPLVDLGNLVLGGHEISARSVAETIDLLHARSGLFSESLIRASKRDLQSFERNIRPGIAPARTDSAGPHRAGLFRNERAARMIERIRGDLRRFAERHRLHQVVVVNVASTEEIVPLRPVHREWSRLERALKQRPAVLPPSSLYALAAIEEAMPWINFTPSLGADLPALRERAEATGACIMGADGKTGETLLKSVLAPMFRDRALRVLSWAGHNILGNRDGQSLSIPARKAAKLRTKNGLLGSILGRSTRTHTAIEFVESLDDWKTAWDHVHFEGFLGTKMSLQFIWQGCDSILAAPLVLDLARLAEYHATTGGRGVMTHLACFFKAPMDVAEHRFSRQVEMLMDYAAKRARRR